MLREREREREKERKIEREREREREGGGEREKEKGEREWQINLGTEKRTVHNMLARTAFRLLLKKWTKRHVLI
jgi:hypothetical protein